MFEFALLFFELKQIIFKCVYVKNKVPFNLIAIKFNKCYNACATYDEVEIHDGKITLNQH